MESYLDEALIEYGSLDIYPFHMPGHKRQKLGDFTPEEIDITEVEGFDDLHHAEGILLAAQERLARVFGADESCYLVNGSTAGILASICGCVQKGGRLLIARNCHKSVYHAAYLSEAKLEYLIPEQTECGVLGSIAPAQVKEALGRFPDTCAVVLTSPTYDGVVSDIHSIADIVHEAGIPLIVDAAHGAHFGFAKAFPQKPIALGADLSVESLHKTLPAYTQSAALHLMHTSRYDAARVKRYLDIFQSSSPSYVLMAGIDRCVRMIGKDEALYAKPETRAESLFGQFEARLRRFYGECESFKTVRVSPDASFGIYAWDPSRILISAGAAGLSGQRLYDLLLEKYHLRLEMAGINYAVALTGIMDTDEGFARLFHALDEIDHKGEQTADSRSSTPAPDTAALYGPKEKRLEIAQAMEEKTASLPLPEASGRISAEFVYLYPPGIPILVPGEVLTREVIAQLALCKSRGMQIKGMRDPAGEEILVCAS